MFVSLWPSKDSYSKKKYFLQDIFLKKTSQTKQNLK